MKKTEAGSVNIPNPNVYFEYGLMTALGKYVIPLQKDGQVLAFNIQTHDTIKYTPRNLSAELDRAFKDATKLTQEDRSGHERQGGVHTRLFSRSLEINGYQAKSSDWYLSDEIDDTYFEGYEHPKRHGYVFFAIAEDRDSLVDVLTDMQVITKRLETRVSTLEIEAESLSSEIEQLKKEVSQLGEELRTAKGLRDYPLRTAKRSLESTSEKKEKIVSRIDLIQSSKFAVILTPEVVELKAKVIDQHKNMDNKVLSLPLCVGDITGIQIDDLSIEFKRPVL